MRFSDQNASFGHEYTPEYYNDKASLPTSTSVSVDSGANTPNIDAVLTLTGPEITEPIASVIRLSGADRYATSAKIVRIGGANRYETSLNVASFGFSFGTNTAFFATGANFPDALLAASAAAKMDAPVILVQGRAGTVDAPTKVLLSSIRAVNLYIAGGTGVVSNAMASSLASLDDIGFVERLSGSDRYLTSLDVNRFFGAADTVYLATGTGFADALSGAALAGSTGAPLYVVPGNCVPVGVLQAIADLHATTLVLLGGTGAPS